MVEARDIVVMED